MMISFTIGFIQSNLKSPFLSDEQEQGATLLRWRNSGHLTTTEAVSKLSVAEKHHQVILASQTVYLMQSEE